MAELVGVDPKLCATLSPDVEESNASVLSTCKAELPSVNPNACPTLSLEVQEPNTSSISSELSTGESEVTFVNPDTCPIVSSKMEELDQNSSCMTSKLSTGQCDFSSIDPDTCPTLSSEMEEQDGDTSCVTSKLSSGQHGLSSVDPDTWPTLSPKVEGSASPHAWNSSAGRSQRTVARTESCSSKDVGSEGSSTGPLAAQGAESQDPDDAAVQKQKTQVPKWYRQAKSEDADLPDVPGMHSAERLPSEPKRPKNAFLLFCAEERMKIQKTGKMIDNRMVSRMLGMKWRQMSAAQKKPYQEESARLYRQIKENHPDWRYSPGTVSSRMPQLLKTSKLRPRDKVKWKLPPLLKRQYRRRDKVAESVQGTEEEAECGHFVTFARYSAICVPRKGERKLSPFPKTERKLHKGMKQRGHGNDLEEEREGAVMKSRYARLKRKAAQGRFFGGVQEIEIVREEAEFPLDSDFAVSRGSESSDLKSGELWQGAESPLGVNMEPEEIEDDCEEDAYGCGHCGKWFRNSEALERHIVTHSQAKQSSKRVSNVEENRDRRETNAKPFRKRARMTARPNRKSGGARETSLESAPLVVEGCSNLPQQTVDTKQHWIAVPIEQLPNMVSHPTLIPVEPTMYLIPASTGSSVHQPHSGVSSRQRELRLVSCAPRGSRLSMGESSSTLSKFSALDEPTSVRK